MRIVFILSWAVFCPCALFAHGVQGEIGSGGVVVQASYDSGEAMSYARVDIAAPGGGLPFQSGRTDRNGRFCFFPDVPGLWKVVVNDGQGHQLDMEVVVDHSLLPQTKSSGANTRYLVGRWQGVVAGVGLIFGLAGVLAMYRKKDL